MGEVTGIPRTDLTLGEHISILLGLIKNTYEPEQTYHSAKHLILYRYVFIIASGKMWGRVKCGESRMRFLLDRLQTSHESLPSDVEDDGTLETPSHTFVKSERNALQSMVNVLSVDPEFDATPLQPWVDALDIQDPIVYNTRMFQYLLESVVSRFFYSLKRLVDLKANFQLQYVKDELEDGSDEQRINNMGIRLDQAAHKVALAAYCMVHLKAKSHLRFLLKKHLKWLFELRIGSSTQAFTHFIDPSSDLNRLMSDDPRMEQSRGQFLFDSDSKTDKGEEASTQIYASDFHNIDVSIRNKDIAEAGVNLLDLICLQMTAIDNLSFSSQNPARLKKFVLQANFDWVKHYTDKPDKSMMSLNDLLKAMQKDNGEVLTQNEIEDFVKPWLAERHSHLKAQVVDNTPSPGLEGKSKEEMTESELKSARKDFLK